MGMGITRWDWEGIGVEVTFPYTSNVNCVGVYIVQKQVVLSTSIATMSSAISSVLSHSTNQQFRHTCLAHLQVIPTDTTDTPA